MKFKKFYVVFLIITQIILMNSTDCAESEGIIFSPRQEDMFNAMEKIFAELDRSDEDMAKRVKQRSKGRQLQRTGEKLSKKVKKTTAPFRSATTTFGLIASATGDPSIKAVVAMAKISLIAVNGLGQGVGSVVSTVGRYKERSQEILSTTEVLIESIQKSIEKIKTLRKKQQSLLKVTQLPKLSKKLGKKLSNAPIAVQDKVRHATDVLTSTKAKEEEKLKAIGIALKEEGENFSEVVRLFQIKLLQDAIKEFDKRINVEATIEKLKNDIVFYNQAKESTSSNRSKAKRQLADIERKLSKAQKELEYYEKFKKSSTESLEVLKKNKSALIEKTEQLTKLTKLADSIYLQEKGIDPDETKFNKTMIINLYKKLDDLKSQINTLKQKISTSTTPSSSAKAPPSRPSSAPPPPPQVNQPTKGGRGNLPRTLPSSQAPSSPYPQVNRLPKEGQGNLQRVLPSLPSSPKPLNN